MNVNDSIAKCLVCIDCGGDLKKGKNHFECVKCKRKYPYKLGILNCMSKMEDEKLFSNNKWDEFWQKWYQGKDGVEEFKKEENQCRTYIDNNIKRYYKTNKNTVYLELGSGCFYIGNILAEECGLVIGIDFSLPILMIAKKILDKRGIKNYILIWGDIFKMPLKKSCVDLIYGGGVMEHFKDTYACVNEFSRITKKGGMVINAVPYLNLGSLTYRQRWGNIPDFPILKSVAEFVHIKLLKGKHMYFGYELSFTKNKLKKLHQQTGFSDIKFCRLEIGIMLYFLPAIFRPVLRKLAENCPWFWPMILVIAKK